MLKSLCYVAVLKQWSLIMFKVFRLLVLASIALPACNCTIGNVTSVSDGETIFGNAVSTGRSYSNLTVCGKATLKSVTISEKMTVNGYASVADSKINHASIRGKLDLGKTTASDKISVSGSTNISNSTLKSFSVFGKIFLKESTVSEPSDIRGSIISERSTLDKVTINASDPETKISFFKSTTKTLTIISKNTDADEYLVELDDTTVDGDIVFEGKKGQVILKGNAKVTGKIIGGETETH
jgi:hypothetical protein